jgi:hypothetical protein
MELLDDLSHTSLSNTTTSEDIASIIGDFMCTASGEGFEQADWSAKILVLVRVGHCVHLMRDLLEPSLSGFCMLDHACKPGKRLMSVSCVCISSEYDSLSTNDWLFGEGLSKDDALIAPLQALFRDSSHPLYYRCCHCPTFVVEVAHDDLEAFVLFAQEMIHRNLDVVKLNVGCSSRRRVTCLLRVKRMLGTNLCMNCDIP